MGEEEHPERLLRMGAALRIKHGAPDVVTHDVWSLELLDQGGNGRR